MRRRRILTPLALLAVLAASCANHGDPTTASGDDSTPAAGPTTTAAAAAQPGQFGTMEEPVCGPGSGGGATAQGVSATSIKIGVTGDANNTVVPDLNKELYEASEAFVKWCNDAGGINGRKIEMTKRDGGLLKAREAMTEACAEDFAVVGGGLAFDFEGVKVRTACGLTEFPGFGSSVDNREAPNQVSPFPFYKNQFGIVQYNQIAKAFPGAVAHFGLLMTNIQLGSGRPLGDRTLDAIKGAGYKAVYRDEVPTPPAVVDNWRPYVEDMKAKGVRILDFEVTPELLVPLLRAMRDVGWYPDAIVLPGNFYNEVLLDAGDALKNVYVNAYIVPFELADENPSMKQYTEIMDAGSPGWKKAALSVNSFSAWLLFAKAAKECGADLTRACVEEKGLATGMWDAGGLHAPGNVDLKANPTQPTCGVLLEATPDGFVIDKQKTGANTGIFNCSAENTVEVAP